MKPIHNSFIQDLIEELRQQFPQVQSVRVSGVHQPQGFQTQVQVKLPGKDLVCRKRHVISFESARKAFKTMKQNIRKRLKK